MCSDTCHTLYSIQRIFTHYHYDLRINSVISNYYLDVRNNWTQKWQQKHNKLPQWLFWLKTALKKEMHSLILDDSASVNVGCTILDCESFVTVSTALFALRRQCV